MPLSAARRSANASNAQLSTGPRTPDGEARSAQNARKHGLTAAWNLRRIRVMETELYSRAATCSDLLDDDVLLTKLDRLARHKSHIERTFHRSLKELKSLQRTPLSGQ